MSEQKDSAGRGKYSRVIRGLHEGITALEAQCERALSERDAKIDALAKALRLARARIDYLGAACINPRHSEANADTFFPAIDEVLSAVGKAPDPK